jgi:DNA-binding transcriptional LysR family regulator
VNRPEFDLNLLTVFEAVWRLRNVSEAADEIGLSQPAVSNALRRLRVHFHDRLFVRTATGMLPTPVAEQLGRGLVPAFSEIRNSLRGRRDFHPEKDERTFAMLMTDVGEVVLLPRLLRHCRDHAPNVSIRTVQVPAERTMSALEVGDVDLAIGYIPQLQSGIYQQQLFHTAYVCMVRRDHPTIGTRMSRRQFLSALHAVAESTGTSHYAVEQQLNRLGVRRRIGLRVSHLLSLPAIVGSTNMVATVPESLGAVFESSANTRILPHPVRFARTAIKQYWHERFHEDVANRWLRHTCAMLFQRNSRGTTDRDD